MEGFPMADGVTTQAQTPNRIRFARIAAGAAFAFALIGLVNTSLALEAAGAVCAIFAAVFAILTRDMYAGAGGVVAMVIAVTSPAVGSFVSSYSAQQAATQEAQAAQVAADIAEVEQYDARLAGYQPPDQARVEQGIQEFKRATDMLAHLRDQYRIAQFSNPDGAVNIRNSMASLKNQIETGQAQIRASKSTMDQKFAEHPAKWSHAQELCAKPKVRDADACRRMGHDHELYLGRVKQAFADIDRLTATYNAEQPKQQAILDSVS
jgi:hypothetical protein